MLFFCSRENELDTMAKPEERGSMLGVSLSCASSARCEKTTKRAIFWVSHWLGSYPPE